MNVISKLKITHSNAGQLVINICYGCRHHQNISHRRHHIVAWQNLGMCDFTFDSDFTKTQIFALWAAMSSAGPKLREIVEICQIIALITIRSDESRDI